MPDPYADRIREQKQRIRQHSGDDSQLRDRLNQLRKRRNQQGGGKDQFMQTPWNSQYESTVGNAQKNYNLSQIDSTLGEQGIEKAYGFNDTSDPFSRASMLQQQFANANRGTGNNYAAAGQLYAGSLSNARDIDRQNFEQNWDASQKEYQAKLYDIAQRRLQDQQGFEQAKIDAEGQRLEDALQERVDPQEAPQRGPQQGKQGGKNDGGKKDKPKDDKPNKGGKGRK